MLRRRIVMSLLAATVLIGAAAALNENVLDSFQPRASSATFSILDRPPTTDDIRARAAYTGDQTVSLKQARLAGTDSLTQRSFFLTRNDDDICLVVVAGPAAAAGGCEHATTLATGGLWVKYGDDSSSFIAIAVPDEYADATVRTSGTVLLREPNLVVARAEPLGVPTRVTLVSPRFKDWSITTSR